MILSFVCIVFTLFIEEKNKEGETKENECTLTFSNIIVLFHIFINFHNGKYVSDFIGFLLSIENLKGT